MHTSVFFFLHIYLYTFNVGVGVGVCFNLPLMCVSSPVQFTAEHLSQMECEGDSRPGMIRQVLRVLERKVLTLSVASMVKYSSNSSLFLI